MKYILYYFFIFLLIISSCSFPAVNTELQDENVEQLTQGLMNSSWPMFGHDTYHTSRSSNSLEGNLPILKWKYNPAPNPNHDNPIFSSPVIDKNGAIYFGSTSYPYNFHVINPDGSLKWRRDIGGDSEVNDASALAADGTIYVGYYTDGGGFYALYPDGTIKWIFNTNNRDVDSAPAIAEDGTIYFCAGGFNSGGLYAIHSNGSLKWWFNTDGLVFSSPAIDEKGIVYFGSQDTYLYALYPNGTLNWKFKTQEPIIAAPAISEDGAIYICSWDDMVYSVDQNGSLKWSYQTDSSIQGAPAIDSEGTLYVTTYAGSLYALYPDGALKWELINLADDSILASPVVDANGIIYFGSFDDCFYAIKPDSNLHWKVKTTGHIDGSAAISSDGTIYFGNWNGDLYAYQTVQNEIPRVPEIHGPQTGKSGREYTFQISSVDSESENLYYWVDWGDNSNSGWIGPYSSGELVDISHRWFAQGDYCIRVKAMDDHPEVLPPSRETEFKEHTVVLSRSKNIVDYIQDIYRFVLSLCEDSSLYVLDSNERMFFNKNPYFSTLY